jgi:putative transposase
MEFRRYYQPSGRYFFTVVTYRRQPILTQPKNIERLRHIFRDITKKKPFRIDAIVILPDHLHTVWQLPEGDADFSIRWRMIKHDFSVALRQRPITDSQIHKREKPIWQRRFWEHGIRDENDWRRHIDYVHYNPVKHGYVSKPSEWPFSSFRNAIKKGWYGDGWGNNEPDSVKDLWFE